MDDTFKPYRGTATYSLNLGGRLITIRQAYQNLDQEICERSSLTEDKQFAVIVSANEITAKVPEFFIYDIKSDQEIKPKEVANTSSSGSIVKIFSWQSATTLNLLALNSLSPEVSYVSLPLEDSEQVLEMQSRIEVVNFYEGTVTVDTSRGRVVAYIADEQLRAWDLRADLKGLAAEFLEPASYNPYKGEVRQTLLLKDAAKPVSFVNLSRQGSSPVTACSQQLPGNEFCALFTSATQP
jgi:hypothetical protein